MKKYSTLQAVAATFARETGIMATLLIGVSIVVFTVLYFSPGDPFKAISPDIMSIESGDASSSGGGKSWAGMYVAWFSGMVRGDFGTSSRTGLPVFSEVLRVGINTLYLTLGSTIVTLLVAVPIALFSARLGMTAANWGFTMLAYVVSALPVFWLGYIAIYVFTRKLGIFPIAFGLDNISWIHFILPILVLGIGNGTISEIVRYLREEMERVFSEDYIRTAKAKGASVWRHSFKEGFLLPITAIIASKIPFILGGAVVVEQVFNWPGMGRMAWQAAQDRDYPVIMGITILSALVVRFGSLIQSVIQAAVIPAASKE